MPGSNAFRLSAAMIVRDEEAHLDACLASVAPLVDEIVIVDTGSRDRTLEIARSYGARVFECPWQDDFSLHRNQSLDLARGEWVLVVDGDEELTDPGDLRARVDTAEESVDSIAVHVRAIGDTGPSEHHEAVRAFRRTVGRYEQPVHNQLVGVRRTARSSAVVTSHYEGRLAAKVKRSKAILLRMLDADQESAHACYFLAKTCWAATDFEGCLHWGERARALVDGRPGYASLWVWLFYAALALRGPDAAESYLAEGLVRHPWFPELRHCQLAIAALRWNQASGRLGRYAFTEQASLRHLGGLPDAARLLGLPLAFERREQRADEHDERGSRTDRLDDPPGGSPEQGGWLDGEDAGGAAVPGRGRDGGHPGGADG